MFAPEAGKNSIRTSLMDTELVVRDEERLPYDGREEWVAEWGP